MNKIIITKIKHKYIIKTHKSDVLVYKKLFPYVFIKHRVFDDLDKAIKYIN